MEITAKVENGSLIIGLIGELDEQSATYARKELDGVLEDLRGKVVIFDLKRLSFMDSTGIGVLIGRYKVVKKCNAVAYVKNPSVTVDKIFTMSGLYEIMPKLQ